MDKSINQFLDYLADRISVLNVICWFMCRELIGRSWGIIFRLAMIMLIMLGNIGSLRLGRTGLLLRRFLICMGWGLMGLRIFRSLIGLSLFKRIKTLTNNWTFNDPYDYKHFEITKGNILFKNMLCIKS